MNILIVDDEVIVRTGLSTVINWEEIGITLLPPAASAEEALERIPNERPDIILTDIRMTGKDGLELSKMVKEQYPETEIIILSGYDDFSYAQKAIRNGISDYVLKTSGPEEIIKATASAKRRIIDRRELELFDTFQRRESRNSLFEKLLVEGVIETKTLDQCVQALSRLGADINQLYVMIVSASGWGKGNNENELLQFSVANVLEDTLACETLAKKDNVVVIVNEGVAKELSLKMNSVISKVNKLLKCEVFIACSSPVTNFEELSTSYNQADYIYNFKFLLHGIGFHPYDEITKRKGGRNICSHEEENELGVILLNNHRVSLQRWINERIQELLQDPEVTYQSFSAYLKSLQIAGYRWLDRATSSTGKDDQTVGTGTKLPTLLPQDTEVDLLYKHLSYVMKNYHEIFSEDRSSLIHKAVTYIKNNLGKETTLLNVSTFVHINPTYFSEVFKQEIGLTFGEFLTKERIKKASELLVSSPAKVTEISSSVGYEDEKYFRKLFKKHTGLTPSKYRERNE